MYLRFILILGLTFTINGCNQAFMEGLAQGLAKNPPVYSPSSSGSSSTNSLDEIRKKREARQQERNMKDMCKATGGRWRVGRCKY